MTEWVLLAVAVALVAANAVFVAAEFSLITADRATVERAAAAGDGRAASLQQAMRSLSTQLSGAQLGITVTSLVVGFIAEPSLATILRGRWGSPGCPTRRSSRSPSPWPSPRPPASRWSSASWCRRTGRSPSRCASAASSPSRSGPSPGPPGG